MQSTNAGLIVLIWEELKKEIPQILILIPAPIFLYSLHTVLSIHVFKKSGDISFQALN